MGSMTSKGPYDDIVVSPILFGGSKSGSLALGVNLPLCPGLADGPKNLQLLWLIIDMWLITDFKSFPALPRNFSLDSINRNFDIFCNKNFLPTIMRLITFELHFSETLPLKYFLDISSTFCYFRNPNFWSKRQFSKLNIFLFGKSKNFVTSIKVAPLHGQHFMSTTWDRNFITR